MSATSGTPRREQRVFFPWEARRSQVLAFVRRNMRLVLVGAVAGVIAWGLGRVEARKRAVFATRASIAVAMQAVEAYRNDHAGACPASLVELVTPRDGHEPYIARLPHDGWGNEFHFRCPGRSHPETADLTSPGPTGNMDDADQIE